MLEKIKGKKIFDKSENKIGKIAEEDKLVPGRVWIDWDDNTSNPISISLLGSRYKLVL